MADKSWKAFERRICKLFGGQRRGADYEDHEGRGKNDCIAPGFSIECKLLSRPSFQQMLDAAIQAETASYNEELPIAVVKRKGDPYVNTLVIMRLDEFVAWFGPGESNESEG